MTNLTAAAKTAPRAEEGLFANLKAAIPSATELVETVLVLTCGAAMTLLLNALL